MCRKGAIVAETGTALRDPMTPGFLRGQAPGAWHNPAFQGRRRPAGTTVDSNQARP
jgi:hypothetical protein